MALIVYVIIIAISLLFLKWYVQRRRFVKHLERFPGPPPLPVVGNALEFESPKDFLPKFAKFREEYGNVVKLTLGPTSTMLIITDYKFLEYLLSSTTILDKTADYKYLLNWLGTGLLLSDGDAKWKKHRKIITPTFHFQILEQFIGVFDSASKILVEKLQLEVGKPSVNIFSYIILCTLDIICETAMGTSLNAQENSNSEYVQSVKAMCRIIVDRTFNPLLQNNFLYLFSKQYRTEKKAIGILHNYANSVISTRKRELQQTGFQQINPNEEYGSKRKLALLDLLLQESAKIHDLTDEDIREEIDTFMFAGHDTTATALGFCLHCLVLHPNVQRKIVEELQEIFSDDWTRPGTYRDFQEMKYMEAVIKESLRLYPPVPFYGRNISEDVPYDGGILPKGLTLIVDAYGIHRNPELFPDPSKFDPERFLGTNVTNRQYPYAYIPFSAGPRNCIGQKYAMLEMKCVLSRILRQFELRTTVPVHEPVISAETVLKSENGICIRLIKRQL